MIEFLSTRLLELLLSAGFITVLILGTWKISRSLGRVEGRLQGLEKRQENLENHIDSLKQEMKLLSKSIEHHVRTLHLGVKGEEGTRGSKRDIPER